jgi:hypothetical protein
MTSKKQEDKRIVSEDLVTEEIKIPDFAKSKLVKKQVSVLGRLTDWQKKSAQTNWVIGEYLHGH